MAIKVGINGFGRIGRVVFRVAMSHPEIEIVAVNDLTDAATLAHLLKYDSTHGRLGVDVKATDKGLVVGGRLVKVTAERDPANLPWGDLGVDVVLESTGVFRSRDKLELHLKAGAPRVLLSVPSKSPEDVDATIVLGVNDADLTADAKIVSNASCTTNCLAPLVKAVNDAIGVEEGLMTTIHSYTNDQSILDFPHADLRRARSAAANMIPTSTGAAKAIVLVIPELKGKLNGISVRVPTVTGSLVDLVAVLKRKASADEINAAVRAAAEGPMKGILSYCEDPIVSSDVIRDSHSSVFDSLSTMTIGDRMVKLVAWYDNEWGYSSRCVDLFKKMAAL
ncbi:MAG: type I glyceraldehyde-3-phosphate dehydrogenase [Verrucomicrobia bacterium]|nr:type I glyceraldehyde-3-phosphate dehydrogenase [Verrucomicrobiota bacterium]